MSGWAEKSYSSACAQWEKGRSFLLPPLLRLWPSGSSSSNSQLSGLLGVTEMSGRGDQQPGMRRHCREAALFQLLLWERSLVLNVCAALFSLAHTPGSWRVNSGFAEQQRKANHVCVPSEWAAGWSLWCLIKVKFMLCFFPQQKQWSLSFPLGHVFSWSV